MVILKPNWTGSHFFQSNEKISRPISKLKSAFSSFPFPFTIFVFISLIASTTSYDLEKLYVFYTGGGFYILAFPFKDHYRSI